MLHRTVVANQVQLQSVRRMVSSRLASSLVLVDHDNKTLNQGSLKALDAATKVGGDVVAFVTGANCGEVAKQVAKVAGVTRVVVADHASLENGLPEAVTKVTAKLHEKEKFSHIFGVASTFGKAVLPRLAGVLDVGAISDITEVKAPDTFIRTMYAGNVIATVKSNDPVKIITVRTTAFENPKTDSGNAKIESFGGEVSQDLSTFVKRALTKSDRPSLDSAKTVVSGGRGVKSKEGFEIVYQLADALNGAAGASRAACDAQYCPADLQVGQTGKIVAPQLYVALGISGAIQHLAGMKDSKCIVAINTDADAPIFQVADYGLVEDIKKAVPEMISLLKK